jgi:hypothetical protein
MLSFLRQNGSFFNNRDERGRLRRQGFLEKYCKLFLTIGSVFRKYLEGSFLLMDKTFGSARYH